MLSIGLTGGIASGKSTAANLFSELGVPIIDADKIAHQLTEPNQPAYHAIVEHFGPSILEDNDRLNRKALRDIIFKQPEEKVWLEELLHPIIRKTMQTQAQSLTAPYAIFVIPLLVETGKRDWIDRVLLIDIPQDLQLQRTQARDHCSAELAQNIIHQQADRELRQEQADDIICNDQDLEHLKQAVEEMHEKYSKMA